jgi:hypothetical protein
MSRRLRLVTPLAVLGLLATALFWGRLDGQAQSLEESAKEVAPLKDQLEKGLRARRPVEFQFVRRVAQLVDNKQLSLELVQGTFAWTRKKYPTKKYLVPHFEQALRLRAAVADITVLDNVPTTLPKIANQ